jgi:hypothetical protein
MTSDVKGWEQLFSLCLLFFSFVYRQSWSQSDTTVEHADIRGLAPYREVFCRAEGFDHLSRYVTGLLLSPNKT